MNFGTLKSNAVRFAAVSLSGVIVASTLSSCSNTADKGAVPPLHKFEKVKDSDEHTIFNQQVDILMVIDDSYSMTNHQANVARNIRLFTAELAKSQLLDYHIGVVTTSMDQMDRNTPWDPAEPWNAPCDSSVARRVRACGDGRLVRFRTNVPFIDRNTPDGLNILKQNINVGSNGSDEEHSFDPIYAALSEPFVSTINAGFLRSDASLAIIFVTDAEDQSTFVHSQSLYDFLVQRKGGRRDKLMAYGALVPTDDADPTCPRDTPNKMPVEIETFIAKTKGIEFNICDVDYGTKLATVAKDVVAKVNKIMYLSRRPVVETISVVYGSQVIPNEAKAGWTYDPSRNALNFGDLLKYTVQPQGTELEVNFTAGTFD